VLAVLESPAGAPRPGTAPTAATTAPTAATPTAGAPGPAEAVEVKPEVPVRAPFTFAEASAQRDQEDEIDPPA
jgi:hypothetical protein